MCSSSLPVAGFRVSEEMIRVTIGSKSTAFRGLYRGL